jgi:hypothetical protein
VACQALQKQTHLGVFGVQFAMPVRIPPVKAACRFELI